MILRTLIFSTFLFTLLACGPTATAPAETTPEVETPAPLTFAEKVETAHQKESFRSHEAIQFDLQLFFGGNERLNGTLTLSTDSRQALIAYKDGKKIYVQDDKMFVAPETENLKSTRFAAYTWSYFFMLPYKLNDSGTVWNDYPNTNLNGDTYATGKLSFAPGTGDAPDDWYVVYADTETLLTQVAAYIVTAGKSQEEAEEDPHAIQYLNYQKVDGIPIATEWKFWGWQPDQGLTEQLGEATLRNISFVTPAEGFFTPPANFIEG
ncbi:DUF6503 family protein [Lewinella cohaerens]|uniref:DUF6503 family protein n=1 Tax=Lewinella cohaerens TaxID=70995 RepID=UPI00036155E3|nr:DUF6503 family protein [Lewinella cohaerens]